MKRGLVFEKAQILTAQLLIDPSKKLYDIKSFKEIDSDQYYYECSTDEDSSDYESVKK